jgi:dUTPase
VCSGDTVKVSTGIHVTVSKNETARLLGIASGVVEMNVTTGELFIDVYNKYNQNLMIYPGMVLAEILVAKKPGSVSARKPRASKSRKTRMTSSARLISNESK